MKADPRALAEMLTSRIIHGDCFEALAEFPDESVDLVLTDPPYAIHYRSNRRVKRPRFAHMTGDRPGDWIETFADLSHRLLKPNRHLYCFCRHDTYPRFWNAFQAAGFKMKRTLIWVKNNHGSGDLKGDWAPRDEWIIFAQKGRRLLRGRRRDNVLKFGKIPSAQLLHPTQKPLELLKLLIRKSTAPGELVLDPFAGVLTTAAAAIELGRSFIAIDINETFLRKGMEMISERLEGRRYDLEVQPGLSVG